MKPYFTMIRLPALQLFLRVITEFQNFARTNIFNVKTNMHLNLLLTQNSLWGMQ
jgi:hypothetical protein